MKIITYFRANFAGKYARIALLFSGCLFLSALLLTLNAVWMFPNSLRPYKMDFYFAIFLFLILTIGAIVYFSQDKENNLIKKIFLTILPTAIILLFGICVSRNFNSLINFLVGFYWIALGSYLYYSKKNDWHLENMEEKPKHSFWQNKWQWGLVTLLVLIYLAFGSFHIDRFAAVDEPLWSFGRIPQYWKALEKRNWGGTLVSDKPGVTVSLISGAGLLWENPQDYDTLFWEGRSFRMKTNIEDMNMALRLPIFLFTVLLMPFFYFFIRKIWNKNAAILSLLFLCLSPVLIGVSRIINPDALLWSLSGLTILSFLSYIKSREKKYVLFTGIFWGLSLLTKYIANLFFVYFLGIILLDYAFNPERYKNIDARKYIKESLQDYAAMIFFALAIVSIFLPMIWIMPKEILSVTINSQAFHSSWPIFAALLFLIIFDTTLIRGKLFSGFSNFFQKYKSIIIKFFVFIFLASSLFVLIDVFTGMKMVDLEKVFISPKSQRYMPISIDTLPIFFANFYPLIFGISPLALILAIYSLFLMLKKSNTRYFFVFYLVIFIMLYYLGSAINGVASITRYQIMVFPIMLIISGLGAHYLLDKIKKPMALAVIFLTLLLVGTFSLFKTYPFYMSYASDLLPKKYSLDLKDMGAGSYEAAEYLNSLPNAKDISIWTDKSGVCYFFKGFCFTGFNPGLKQTHLDYIVVSSGRESRTDKMTRKNAPDFTPYYDNKKGSIAFELFINGRQEQFVKIIKN